MDTEEDVKKRSQLNKSDFSSTGNQTQSQSTYILYPYRWALQLVFCMCISSCGIFMNGFSPVAEIIAKIYNCSAIIV
jgi:hypothetical protein